MRSVTVAGARFIQLDDRASERVLSLAAAAGGDGEPSALPGGRRAAGPEDLPYRVEVWDESRSFVEQLLAVTAHASIGHAAFYAATRDFPERYITLRNRGQIVVRWNETTR